MNTPRTPGAPSTPLNAAKSSTSFKPAQPAGSATPQAAHGDDQVMSQPPKAQQNPASDKAWKAHVSAAHVTWDKISEEELIKTQGERDTLALLVEKRYSINRSEADKQVKSFFDRRIS
jgi:hypothetical protein